MKRVAYIVSLILFLGLSGCEGWLDVNQNPNNPASVEYQMVLPSGITSVMYVMGGRYQVLGALWSQHWTQSLGASQYTGIDSYDINSSSFDNQFGELYAGALKAFEYVRTESARENEWNYYLIATVMQAYTFQVLADLYDEIPFSEALAGEDGSMAPHYEKGQDIYDSLIMRIDKALDKDLDADELENPGSVDVLFDGDMDRWIEFANTLKLKIYLRQTEVRPEVARQGIEALYAEDAEFLSVDAKFEHFQNQSGQRNPLYETEINAFGNNPNLILSRTLHSYLEDNGDYYRLDYMFYTPQSGGGHKSLVQGNYNDPEEPTGTNSSGYSKPIVLPAAPVYLLSYTEACFLQAEAITRYHVADYADAKEKYDDGLREAYLRVLSIASGLSTDNKTDLIDGFINNEYRFPTDGSPVEEFIKSIITQKWVSLAGIQSLETFFEHNRTHYPASSEVLPDNENYEPGEFTISVNNVTSGRYPKRLLFPESEISTNPNTPVVKSVWETIWWDIKSDTK
ncbi:MAG: SusD/RagB family nutrient-binding outer membrane lipoprotein [Bacteroidales bacterium]|nr:SusD/RagB family nutrient-binding outer membrane lipoprotein [Bacteroidales bacterium]